MNSPLDFPYADLPQLGHTIQVADGVAWIRMPLPFALDHINLWLLDDDDGYTAVDTGFASDAVKGAWDQILGGELAGKAAKLLKRSIVTHGHPDHLGLAWWLEEKYQAPMWMTQGDYTVSHLVNAQIAGYGVPAMLDFFKRHGLDDARLAALDKRGNAYKSGVPKIPASYRRMFDKQVISVGKHEWRVMMGFGHAAEHASLYCNTLKVLIAGDMLLPRITTNVGVNPCNPDDDPLRWFLEATAAYRELPADTLVLPSHGRPFRGIHERVDQLHAHHAERCALLINACGTPKHAAELIPVLFERDIADAHQVMFAIGEAIAHLNHLMHAKRLRRIEGSTDDIIRFVTT
jgi:glyoxylase-like metal-dependent hydrolase (beta-lactamase superfamily II)